MYYPDDVLQKAVDSLFSSKLKINTLEKLGFSWGNNKSTAWLIPFAHRKLIMLVPEDELYMDMPSYMASGGSAGLVLEALFYISESIDKQYLEVFQSFYDRRVKEDKLSWLKSKRVLDLPSEDGYFYVYAMARFDFKEILESKGEQDTLLYPDHLLTMPEPKLGLRHAMVDLIFVL